jgi:ferredoxin-type protein NapH
LLDILNPLKQRWRKRFSGLSLPVNWSRIRYALLALFVLLLVLTQSQAPTLVYPPAILVRAAHELVFFRAANVALILIGVYLLVDLFLISGFWCRTLCPGGVLYSLLGGFRLLRIRASEDHCTDCRQCRQACPLGLDPTRDSTGLECDNCGKCISVCGSKALSYRWGHGRH